MATLDDPEHLLERIKEVFDLAEEALAQQIDTSQHAESQAERGNDDQVASSGRVE